MSRGRIIVLTFALAAFVALFGASLGTLDDSFLGLEYVDHYGTQWFYWFAERTLFEWTSPAWTDLFFHPYGKDIYRHTGANVLDAYLAVPFRLIFGKVLGYNLFVLAGLAASGWAFSRLAREFTEDTVALGVGAVLFACSPYVLYELREGRPTQALMVTLPLFLLHGWRCGLRPGWRDPVLAGLWLAATGLWYWFYAFFGGLALLGLGGWRILRPPEHAGTRLQVLVRHGVVAVVAVGLCLPVALPIVLETAGQGQDVPGLLDVTRWTWSRLAPVTEQGSAVGIFNWQPLWGSAGLYTLEENGVERFLPCHRLVSLAALLVVALWAWRPGRLDRGSWLALTLPCLLMATGPLILIGHEYVINPFWGAWMIAVDFLRRLWWPSRAVAIPVITVALAATVVLAGVGRRDWRLQLACALALGGLWFHQLHDAELAPFPTWDAAVPAGYRCLAEGGDEALIELPYSWTQGHLYYQVEHGRPILGGMLENNLVFTPEESVTLRTQNSFVLALLMVAKLEGEVAGWTLADKREVRDLGYGFVVLQKDAYALRVLPEAGLIATARRTRLRRMERDLDEMVGDPIYEDERIAIFAPWGDPLPCDPSTIEPDLESGSRHVVYNTLLTISKDEAAIGPLFDGP